jgi:hypothetical protein
MNFLKKPEPCEFCKPGKAEVKVCTRAICQMCINDALEAYGLSYDLEQPKTIVEGNPSDFGESPPCINDVLEEYGWSEDLEQPKTSVEGNPSDFGESPRCDDDECWFLLNLEFYDVYTNSFKVVDEQGNDEDMLCNVCVDNQPEVWKCTMCERFARGRHFANVSNQKHCWACVLTAFDFISRKTK